MRIVLGSTAIVLGFVGVLLCAALIGLGWWAATRSVERIDRIAARLEQGLADADVRLARLEVRLNTIRTDLNEVRAAAEAIATDNPELPRVRAEIKRLLDRLLPALDQAETLADSLDLAAANFQTVADIVAQVNDDPEAPMRVRNAATAIERAAQLLHGLRARVEAVKSAKAVQLTRDLVMLTREAAAGSERLAEGLAAARQEIVVVRARTAEWRADLVFWIYVAAIANTLVWLWGGLGQLCLIGWGRRRILHRVAAPS